VGVLLIIAGVQSNINRRRWASHMALIDSMNKDDDDNQGQEVSDIPEPITSIEQPLDSNRYDDDDIELV
jgi:hypothetical protein